MQFNLPEVGGFDLGRRGPAVDDFGTEDELHVLAVPALGGVGFDGVHFAGLGEEFAGGDGSTASDACGHDGELASVGVPEAGDDRVVEIAVCRLLNFAVHAPAELLARLRVLDPEMGHIGIVPETIAKVVGHSQRPRVVKSAEEDGWALTQIAQRGRIITQQCVVAATHLEKAGKAHQGLEIVKDNTAHLLV